MKKTKATTTIGPKHSAGVIPKMTTGLLFTPLPLFWWYLGWIEFFLPSQTVATR